MAKAQQEISLKLADEARAKRNAISFNVDVIPEMPARSSLLPNGGSKRPFMSAISAKRELEIDGLWKARMKQRFDNRVGTHERTGT